MFSYTFLHTYRDICPHQAAQRYIFKTTKYTPTKEMEWGNEVHSAFEYRIGGGKPLPESMMQWEPFAAAFDGKGAKTEQKVAVNKTGHPTKYFGDDVFLRGKIDTTVMHETTAFFMDWKTGGSKYEDPFELEVGAVMLHAANPHLTKIVGQYAWLKENRVSQIYDLSRTGDTWNEINGIVDNIKRDQQAGAFEKRQSGLCMWCDVFTCENNRNPKRPA